MEADRAVLRLPRPHVGEVLQIFYNRFCLEASLEDQDVYRSIYSSLTPERRLEYYDLARDETFPNSKK